MYACVYLGVCVYTCMCMCVCVCVFICTCMCICIYVYASTCALCTQGGAEPMVVKRDNNLIGARCWAGKKAAGATQRETPPPEIAFDNLAKFNYCA